MNTLILLICVLSNILFAFGGYLAGRRVQIIELHKGDTLVRNEQVKYDDEPAYWLTPEQEAVINAEYQSRLRKESGLDGI
jgi:hypothetical protein